MRFVSNDFAPLWPLHTMNHKQWMILFCGIIGVVIVVLCPRWVYYHATLTPNRKDAGYRFISQSPKPLPVIELQGGRRIVFAGQTIQPRINYGDASLRTGVIIAVVLFGIWTLRSARSDQDRDNQSNTRKLANRMRRAPNQAYSVRLRHDVARVSDRNN